MIALQEQGLQSDPQYPLKSADIVAQACNPNAKPEKHVDPLIGNLWVSESSCLRKQNE